MNYKIYDQLPQEAKKIRIKVFMEEQGFVDLIVKRQEMRSTLIRILKMHGKGA
mgnify:CR=1 FL=1